MVCVLRCSVWVVLTSIAIWAYLKATELQVPTAIDGFVRSDFEKVREKFEELLRGGWIQGAQYAVYYKNELVVDLAGGYADVEAVRLLKRDNYIITYSSVKSALSLLLGIVMDRGGVSFEEPVSKYWPEFAQNGKENVTIGNLVMHQGGVCGLDRKFSFDDAEVNSEYYQKLLAEQRPLTPINGRPYYHPVTYGLYVDQLIRHIDAKKRSARQVLSELASECGQIDLRFGLPVNEYYRLARYYPPKLRMLADNDGLFSVVGTVLGKLNFRWEPEVEQTNGSKTQLTWHQLGGFMLDFKRIEQVDNPDVVSKFAFAVTASAATARDFARLMHILANGGFCLNIQKASGVVPVRVLSRETVQLLTGLRYAGPSGLFPFEESRALLGWMFTSPRNTTLVGSPGLGGQQAFVDPQSHLSVAYFTNHHKPVLLKDFSYTQLLESTYQVLAGLESQHN